MMLPRRSWLPALGLWVCLRVYQVRVFESSILCVADEWGVAGAQKGSLKEAIEHVQVLVEYLSEEFQATFVLFLQLFFFSLD